MKYAENTTVSVEKSLSEIRGLIGRYGSEHFSYKDVPGRAVIEFLMGGRLIRFALPLPEKLDKAFTHKTDGRSKLSKPRSSEAAYVAWEQACRQRWRSLWLSVKGKLETATSGISTFEAEFMPYTVDPATNKTIAEIVLPMLEVSYDKSMKAKPLAITFEKRGET